MGNPRIDPHEEMVVNALIYAFSNNSPSGCRIMLGEKFLHAVPSKEIDSKGIDVMIFLKSGIIVPIQIKAGKETLGIVLPIDSDPKKLPDRLRARFCKPMYDRINRHQRLHPEVKVILFVNDDATNRSIINEINAIIELLIRRLIRNFKKPCADQ